MRIILILLTAFQLLIPDFARAELSYIVDPALERGQSAVPIKHYTIGAVDMFFTTAPSGWLECDGSTIQATDYPRLVAYLAGPNATSAVLPDLRGEFVRGWDHGRGIDAGRVLGSVQAGENLAHTHPGTALAGGNHVHTGLTSVDGAHFHDFAGLSSIDPSGSTFNEGGFGRRTWDAWTSLSGIHNHDLHVDTTGLHTHTAVIADAGAEFRPRNWAIMYAIRAMP